MRQKQNATRTAANKTYCATRVSVNLSRGSAPFVSMTTKRNIHAPPRPSSTRTLLSRPFAYDPPSPFRSRPLFPLWSANSRRDAHVTRKPVCQDDLCVAGPRASAKVHSLPPPGASHLACPPPANRRGLNNINYARRRAPAHTWPPPSAIEVSAGE